MQPPWAGTRAHQSHWTQHLEALDKLQSAVVVLVVSGSMPGRALAWPGVVCYWSGRIARAGRLMGTGLDMDWTWTGHGHGRTDGRTDGPATSMVPIMIHAVSISWVTILPVATSPHRCNAPAIVVDNSRMFGCLFAGRALSTWTARRVRARLSHRPGQTPASSCHDAPGKKLGGVGLLMHSLSRLLQ